MAVKCPLIDVCWPWPGKYQDSVGIEEPRLLAEEVEQTSRVVEAGEQRSFQEEVEEEQPGVVKQGYHLHHYILLVEEEEGLKAEEEVCWDDQSHSGMDHTHHRHLPLPLPR